MEWDSWISVITLHAEDLTLAWRDCVRTGIQKLSVGRKAVTEISVSGRGIINDLLQCVPVLFPSDAEA